MSKRVFDRKRRQFLKTGLMAVGTAALDAVLPETSEANRPSAEETIPLRDFGKTGCRLPILGMGGSAMVAAWIAQRGVPLLGTEERVAMVRHAYNRGVRFFDTARVYQESESIMGKGLEGVRDNVFLATKVAVAEPAQVRKSLEESLRQLDTDRVELVQIHSPAIEKLGFSGAMKLHAELVKLRDEKLFRFIGLTTHVAFETVCQMIATGGFDQVLLAYGYFKKGMDTLLSPQNLEFREMCLAKARDLKMAIVAMKVMGGSVFNHNAKNLVPDYDKDALEQLPGAAIRWVVRDERISMLNIGVSLPADIDRNVAILGGDLTFTNSDRVLLAEFSRRVYDTQWSKKMPVVQEGRQKSHTPLC